MSWLVLRKEKQKLKMFEINLRGWQKEGYEYFKKHPRCIMNVCTGAGKTVFAIHIIKKLLEENPHLNILIAGPKNVILEQVWMDDLQKFGIGIDKIGLYNGFAKEFSKITLCSIQSLPNLIKSGIYDIFDFVIFDEVHNYGSKTYLPLIAIDKPYKLGLTATLERQDLMHIKIKEYFDYNIFKYEIKEALRDGVLNPFEFFHINIIPDVETEVKYNKLSQKINTLIQSMGGISLSKLSTKKKEHVILLKLLNDRKELINDYHEKSVVVKNIIYQNKGSKIIVFNQLNKSSRNLYYDLSDADIKCDLMNSELPDSLQIQIFKDFEYDNIDVLLATTMLDEGYNLPKIDLAILMAQNSTDKQFIQRMGRVLRKKDKDSKVYYITIKGTYEENHFIKKRDMIKEIAKKYEEIIIE